MPKSPWIGDVVLTPERKLWRAVLEQAREDAEIPPELNSRSSRAKRVCARRVLRAAGPFEASVLRLLCDFAAVPFDRVVLWARKQYPQTPSELAASKYIEVLDFLGESDDLSLECELCCQVRQTVA